ESGKERATTSTYGSGSLNSSNTLPAICCANEQTFAKSNVKNTKKCFILREGYIRYKDERKPEM
ncbi:MAG: hypothetical protein IKW99_01180, partial [Bacteroidales bacterium]|nr:hypothetical protein [Bacteroidales bacterium]